MGCRDWTTAQFFFTKLALVCATMVQKIKAGRKKQQILIQKKTLEVLSLLFNDTSKTAKSFGFF